MIQKKTREQEVDIIKVWSDNGGLKKKRYLFEISLIQRLLINEIKFRFYRSVDSSIFPSFLTLLHRANFL